MARLARREVEHLEPVEHSASVGAFGSIDRAFERMFRPWPTLLSFHRPMVTARQWLSESFIPVNEYYQVGSLVIRAEIPGIDPDRDVELTVTEGMLHITATRREEKSVEDERYVRKEIFHGSFERTLPLPEGVAVSDVKANYRDGILEIVVPTPEVEPAKKIAITKG